MQMITKRAIGLVTHHWMEWAYLMQSHMILMILLEVFKLRINMKMILKLNIGLSEANNGRCYEITLSNNHQTSLHSVKLVFDRSLHLFSIFHFISLPLKIKQNNQYRSRKKNDLAGYIWKLWWMLNVCHGTNAWSKT